MTEYGLFNDEGCVEPQLWSRGQAERRLADYDVDDELHVAEICPDHEQTERDSCESCWADEEDSGDADEDAA